MLWPWRKPRLTPADLGYDYHSHLLPGVDDGVASDDEAFDAIEALRAAGYRGAVLTPHIYPDAYRNTEASLQARFAEFAPRARQQFPDFSLVLAAEYLLDDRFLRRLSDEPEHLLTAGGAYRLLLVELPTMYQPAELWPMLDHCRAIGVRAVLAHVERYRYLFSEGKSPLAGIEPMRQAGALLQMNLTAPVGRYGPSIRKTARLLWQAGLIDLLGSDLHRARGAEQRIRAAWRYLGKTGGRFDTPWHQALETGET